MTHDSWLRYAYKTKIIIRQKWKDEETKNATVLHLSGKKKWIKHKSFFLYQDGL